MAVQLGLPVKPVTVKVAGLPSEALEEVGKTAPLAQDRLTLTEAPLLGTKSLLTLNWAVLRVLVMVQLPAVRVALQVPLEV